MKRGFILFEAMLSLLIAMGTLILLIPAFNHLMRAEKFIKQERQLLLTCQEHVRLAETEPLSNLSVRPDFRVFSHGADAAVEIVNPAIKGLTLLRTH